MVETSSFQLEATSTFRPWIAVWLNIADDHLDRHPTVEFAAAKARIFAHQTQDDWAVVNADDPTVMAHSRGIAARKELFSLSGRISDGFVVDGDWIVRRTATSTERLFPLAAVELTGRHMLHNVLAASAAASLAGCPPQAMAKLRGFRGLEHTMEPAGEVRGVRFVNDSKATNVEAARRSIESFPRGVVAIVGGRFKGGDLKQLREPLASAGTAVIAIGEARLLFTRRWTGGAGDRCRRRCARPSNAVTRRPARWRRAAGAGVLELRLVSGLRGPWEHVQGESRAAQTTDGVSGEQSSVVRRGEEPAAGNAGYPGLRGRCPLPRAD